MRILFAGVGTKPTADGQIVTSVPPGSLKAGWDTPERTSAAAAPTAASALPDIDSLQDFLRENVAAELEVAPGSIDTTTPLVSLGVDSMAAMSLCGRVEEAFSVKLSGADVLCGSSIEELSVKIFQPGRQAQGSASIARQPRAP